MDSVHLIIGLGNPGSTYAKTRHNIGFMLVETLARRWTVDWREERQFEARLAGGSVAGCRVLLCEPLTYMNECGRATKRLMQFHQVPPGKMLVILDDADLPLGEVRMKPSGGTGGHHGLESMQQHLGTSVYPRLRLGIGRGAGLREITGYVLDDFRRDEEPRVQAVLDHGARQVECWLEAGIQRAMNDFNGMTNHPENKGTGQ